MKLKKTSKCLGRYGEARVGGRERGRSGHRRGKRMSTGLRVGKKPAKDPQQHKLREKYIMRWKDCLGQDGCVRDVVESGESDSGCSPYSRQGSLQVIRIPLWDQLRGSGPGNK